MDSVLEISEPKEPFFFICIQGITPNLTFHETVYLLHHAKDISHDRGRKLLEICNDLATVNTWGRSVTIDWNPVLGLYWKIRESGTSCSSFLSATSVPSCAVSQNTSSQNRPPPLISAHCFCSYLRLMTWRFRSHSPRKVWSFILM